MRRPVPLIAALALAVLTAACGGASSSTEASRNGEVPAFDEPLAIDNPYLPFARRGRWVYDGTKDGAAYRVEVEVTDETRLVDWSDGTESFETETMVVRHRGWVNDELIEETLDYMAQAEDGSVWYFGEDVDNYEGGQLVDHEGTWLAGIDGALPAMLMPAEPAVGQVFYSEDIAAADIVERDEILAVDAEVDTPGGPVDDGLLVGATQPDGTEEDKVYVPDVGEVLARSDEGELRLIAWHPQGDGADYAPTIDPGVFAATVDNPYFPLEIGATWTYEVITAEGETDQLEVVVTDQTHTVMGVETTVVEVTLLVDGEIEERTDSWYAQDDTGTVWLFGELDEGYEDGELVETSTWEAGVDGAWPGVMMPGNATIDEIYRVGYVPGEMEERGRIVAIDASAEVPAGNYTGLRTVENWSDLEPGVIERKHYAAGIGLVYQDSDHPDADIVSLIATNLSS